MMKDFDLIWPTPIQRGNQVFDNQEKILEASVEYSGQINDDQSLESNKGKLINDPRIKTVKQWMLDTVTEGVSKLNEQFWTKPCATMINEMWSWSSTEYFNPLHSHPNNSWSMIYCVDSNTNEEDGSNGTTMIYSPLPWGQYADPGLAFMERTFMQWHRLNTGDFLLFPSFIRHTAIYSGRSPRTIIAANFSFR